MVGCLALSQETCLPETQHLHFCLMEAVVQVVVKQVVEVVVQTTQYCWLMAGCSELALSYQMIAHERCKFPNWHESMHESGLRKIQVPVRWFGHHATKKVADFVASTLPACHRVHFRDGVS